MWLASACFASTTQKKEEQHADRDIHSEGDKNWDRKSQT